MANDPLNVSGSPRTLPALSKSPEPTTDKPAVVLKPQSPTGSPVANARASDSQSWVTSEPAKSPAVAAPAGPDVSATLAKIDSLVNGDTGKLGEIQLIGIFKSASPDELNAIIHGQDADHFHDMVAGISDHKILGIKVGPQNRTAFLQMLVHDRIGDLDTESRTRVIHGLQYHRTTDQDEGAIRDVFLQTHGTQLSDLKRGVDNGGDHRDLEQVLWHDIDSSQIRGQILDHFKAEATPNGEVKVLSDIDDTFYENFKDDRYPSKTVYPGVRSLYNELDKGPDAKKPDDTGDVTFISARPYDRPGIIEDDLTRKMLTSQGMGDAAVRSGDFAHLIGNHEIADGKTKNLGHERQMYPEYSRVLFGDSGQGDMYFEADALKSGGKDTSAAFLHNVTNMSDAERKGYADQGIFVYDTYVGAATEAFKRGLISKEGLQRVANDALTDLSKVSFSNPDQKAARQADLNRDLAAMRDVLAATSPGN